MSEKILKNIDNKIWKNTSNIIIKNRPFVETVMPNGLTFWGSNDINYLTINAGLVSEAYDLRGTGIKMIQNTVLNRPTYVSGKIIANTSQYLSLTTSATKSYFIVMKYISGIFRGGIGKESTSNLAWNFIGSLSNSTTYSLLSGNTPIGTFYGNLTKYTATYFSNSGYVILHSLGVISNPTTVSVGYLANYSPATGSAEIVEWGWYNRVLNELEVVYNVNALKIKYSI